MLLPSGHNMREQCTYGTSISVACEWMLDGLFIELFGSIFNLFSIQVESVERYKIHNTVSEA